MQIDLALVEKARSGDETSFAMIYDIIAQELYKYALYTLGNSHDAEDVVAETFFEAFKGIKRLKEPQAFKSWMFKILSVRCKKKIAEYIKFRGNYDIDDFVDLSDDSLTAEEIAERTELARAISCLSTDERMIVVLTSMHGYTTLEISKILGIPHGTVSSKLCRTYAKLRKMLGER